MKYVKTIMKTCPMCGTNHYMRLTEVQANQWSDYVCYGGLIQDRMPGTDKFGREFVKSGYCPSCQETLFGNSLKERTAFFSDKDVSSQECIQEFVKATADVDVKESILSEAAGKLSVVDKVLYLYEMDLEEELYVDDAGNVLIR